MDNNSSTYIALIGTFCLLFSSLLPTKSPFTHIAALTIFSISFLLCVLAIDPISKAIDCVDSTAPERLIATNLALFRQNSIPAVNTVLIEGGSYSSRGVNGTLLQKVLLSEGYDTKIIQLTLAGANHLERYHILERFLSELSQEEIAAISDSNLVIMSEIQLGYDTNPLAGLDRNKLSDRAYAYLFPTNSMVAWTALSKSKIIPSSNVLFWDLLEHSIVNFFNIGLVHRVIHSSGLKPLESFQPLETPKKGYKFPGLAERATFFENNPPLFVYSCEWLESYRKNKFYPLLKSVTAEHSIFFSVACVHSNYQQYANSFCRNMDSHECLDATAPSLLSALDHPEFWYDGGHLTQKGAYINTNWLANSLIASGVLVK